MHESKKISLAKAISWRTTGSLATFAIVYYSTGRLDLAAAIGGGETVVKIILFYAHERIWARIITFKPVRRAVYENTPDRDIVPTEGVALNQLGS
jgi:uncharacterized membrane protein